MLQVIQDATNVQKGLLQLKQQSHAYYTDAVTIVKASLSDKQQRLKAYDVLNINGNARVFMEMDEDERIDWLKSKIN